HIITRQTAIRHGCGGVGCRLGTQFAPEACVHPNSHCPRAAQHGIEIMNPSHSPYDQPPRDAEAHTGQSANAEWPFSTLLRFSLLPVVITPFLDDRLLEVNDAFCALTGYS